MQRGGSPPLLRRGQRSTCCCSRRTLARAREKKLRGRMTRRGGRKNYSLLGGDLAPRIRCVRRRRPSRCIRIHPSTRDETSATARPNLLELRRTTDDGERARARAASTTRAERPRPARAFRLSPLLLSFSLPSRPPG